MADKNLSTQEILALARKQATGGAGGESAPAPQGEAAPAQTPVSASPADPEHGTERPAAPTAAPKSTADILAAARAQAAGKAPALAGASPKSTADILAAARSQGAGSGATPAAPKSTADILAAARAGGKGSGAGAPATPAAKAEKPAAKVASEVPAGDRPSVAEMVAAVKQAQRGEKVAPKLPAAPAKPKLPEPKKVSRRRFADLLGMLVITPFAFAWITLTGVTGLWGLLMARFMMPNTVLELPSRFKVGPPSDFPPGTVNEKFKASRGIWLVNTDQYDGRGLVYALASVCTHLGCTPNWLEGEQKFKCPCHGSGFYITGINFEGPAPRPLERVGLRLAEDGMLEVDKSLKFQEELGQWSDGKSFVEVG